MYHIIMRWLKSYGIVDHQLLDGKYLHKLTHAALSLYLFLVVVADKNGRSFYGETTIMDILRFDAIAFHAALQELIMFKLVEYRRPYFILLNLETHHDRRHQKPCAVPQRDKRTLSQANSHRAGPDQIHSNQDILREISRKIAKKFSTGSLS